MVIHRITSLIKAFEVIIVSGSVGFLAGEVSRNTEQSEATLVSMVYQISSQGPGLSGVWDDSLCAIEMEDRRLSILVSSASGALVDIFKKRSIYSFF